jgi:hypothetical protein
MAMQPIMARQHRQEFVDPSLCLDQRVSLKMRAGVPKANIFQ